MAKHPAKKINLALQGGGSHGAYSWGVLDRLLEEEKLAIEGISGTSAGAMNGAVLAHGYMQGGPDGAKAQLAEFWKRVSDAAAFSPLQQLPGGRLMGDWNLDGLPTYRMLDLVSRVFSPYSLNPLNLNPLRRILEEMLDLETLQGCKKMKLFVAATHVASGQARIFHGYEITHDVLLASACLPFLSQAVEVGGEFYWDGGYMGNPAIWPLIYHCNSRDVVLVQINPIRNEKLPRSADEIINRLNEITFNSSLIAEMRAIEFVSKLLRQGALSDKRYKDMLIHLIYSSEAMHGLNASSKMNADWEFFLHLKDIGRAQAEIWLKENWKQVGTKSSIDIHDKFLCGPPKRARVKPPAKKGKK